MLQGLTCFSITLGDKLETWLFIEKFCSLKISPIECQLTIPENAEGSTAGSCGKAIAFVEWTPIFAYMEVTHLPGKKKSSILSDCCIFSKGGC